MNKIVYNLKTTCRSCLCTSENLNSIEHQNEIIDTKLPIGELMMACAEIKVNKSNGLISKSLEQI